jgi:hypothetical protein
MKRWSGLITVLLLSACTAPSLSASGGVEGTITKGPMCPGPVRIGRPCPNQPAKATFLLLDPTDRVVARFRTDAAGRFRVPAPPGRYFVIADPDAQQPFLGGRREVLVPPVGWARVVLTFDTGMR